MEIERGRGVADGYESYMSIERHREREADHALHKARILLEDLGASKRYPQCPSKFQLQGSQLP